MAFPYHAALAFVLASSVALAGDASAANGLAFESVSKFSASADDGGTTPKPGDFQADFALAAAPVPVSGDVSRGPFGVAGMLAKAQSAMAMLTNGTAEKHYVGTTKERVDNVALRTAVITDCGARTITHLDLAKRTYSVVSLDHPAPFAAKPGPQRLSQPEPAATDDGATVALRVTTRAIGSMTIDGMPTAGYATDVKMTATKRGGGTTTSDMHVTVYYAALEDPHFRCATHHVADVPPGGAGSTANLALAMRALSLPMGAEARYKVTSAGPRLPTNRFAMWQSVVMIGDPRHPGGFSVVTERGDLRASISDGDAIFTVPAGFTRVAGSG